MLVTNALNFATKQLKKQRRRPARPLKRPCWWGRAALAGVWGVQAPRIGGGAWRGDGCSAPLIAGAAGMRGRSPPR